MLYLVSSQATIRLVTPQRETKGFLALGTLQLEFLLPRSHVLLVCTPAKDITTFVQLRDMKERARTQ